MKIEINTNYYDLEKGFIGKGAIMEVTEEKKKLLEKNGIDFTVIKPKKTEAVKPESIK